MTNQAALHACGLNAEEAIFHLKQAVSSGDEGAAVPAAEALAWCEMEVRGSLLPKNQTKRKAQSTHTHQKHPGSPECKHAGRPIVWARLLLFRPYYTSNSSGAGGGMRDAYGIEV